MCLLKNVLSVRFTPILLFLALMACEQEKMDTAGGYSMDMARLVSQVTSGLITADDPIRVTFVQPAVDSARIGQTLSDNPFTFNPQIKGQARWKDRRTLVFEPQDRLPFRQTYQGQLHLSQVMKSRKEAEWPDVPIRFQVAGREIQSLDAELQLARPDDPQALRITGQLTLTEPAKPERVKEAVRLQLDDKATPVQWTESADQVTYVFKSRPLNRLDRERELRLHIDSEALDISQDISRRFDIPALTDFAVSSVKHQLDTDPPAVTIVMNEALDPQQDIDGFVTVEPALSNVSVRTDQRNITMTGPFVYGREYTFTIRSGLRSRWQSEVKKPLQETVHFRDMLPEIRFASDGVFLPSGNQQQLRFQAVNVRRVYMEVMKVFTNNLGAYLHMEQLAGLKDRRSRFSYRTNQVGVTVVKDTLFIGDRKNEWMQHALDLQPLMQKEADGIFLLSLKFAQQDMLYTMEEDLEYDRYSHDWYYNNPRSRGYIYRHGQIYKPIILSDIGLTHKQAGDDHYVFASHIMNTQPLAGVQVQLKSYQNQLLAEGPTDAQGMAVFENVDDEVFYVQAAKDGRFSVLKPSDMRWNVSTFDTDGKEPAGDGLKAFIFTERGVYRPGETAHIAAIFRNAQHTFPDNHPVTMQVYNPRQQMVHEQVSKSARDGFCRFDYTTGANDLTGRYGVRFKAGGQSFHHELRIETIVPERLKIEIQTEKEHISHDDRYLDILLSSRYLFGKPAGGLSAEMTIDLLHREKTFKTYGDFSFTNPSRKFKTISRELFKGVLDSAGRRGIRWQRPLLDKAPSAVTGIIEARLTEPGGRSSKKQKMLDIDPYPYYVGMQQPSVRYGYLNTGKAVDIPVIVVSADGKVRDNLTLNYRIYRSEQHWWWEYRSRDRFRMRFKSDETTRLVDSGQLTSGDQPVNLKFTPQDRGQYFVEVQVGPDGHSSGFFIAAYPWGQNISTDDRAGILALRTDAEQYQPGDKARITFPAPGAAAVLFTVEKGNRILQKRWLRTDDQSTEQSIAVNVTREMLPNVYASVSVMQNHDQTGNDRPMRLYGIVPLMVEQPDSRHTLQIETPRVIRPKEDFTVNIRTEDGQPTQLVVAVVDQGLLSLTDFSTPDPWTAFYSKERLTVQTHDLFDRIIGVHKGDIFRTFSIGGGLMDRSYRQRQLLPERARRFENVSLFKGPLQTDDRGRAAVRFTMPNYVGAVDVMAVSAVGRRYGKARRSVPVKSDLMLSPTLPRVIGPGDRFVLPVTVFAESGALGEVTVKLKTDGPLSVSGPTQQTLTFGDQGERTIEFALRARQAVGKAFIELTADAGDATADYRTELAVRASSPYVTETRDWVIQPGASQKMTVPDKGLQESNQARLTVQRRPNLNLNHRFLWLIRYPYGCVEQLVSSAFPQLYMQTFIPASKAAARDMDKHINAAIKRLQKFQHAGGALTYWPGRDEISDWGSLYAAHFLLEARSRGYHVPSALLDGLLGYEQDAARMGSEDRMKQVYRLYVLALAQKPATGAMNLLKENRFDQLRDTHKWLLAAAYQLAGFEETANRILLTAGTNVQDYVEFAGTYGSGERDKAMILEQMVRFERWLPADKLARELSLILSSKKWYSTQSTAYMLSALGKYYEAVEGKNAGQHRLKGLVRLADGRKWSFDTDSISFTRSLNRYIGETVTVELDEASTVKRAFIHLQWSGLPVSYKGQNITENIKVEVQWLDENGRKTDIDVLEQGDRFYQHIRVSKTLQSRLNIEELALTQLLPAGWEIENLRLTDATWPSWTDKWTLNREEYVDMRDDRAMWFFDMPLHTESLDFVLKLNAVTAGQFTLPPTQVEAMYNHNYRAMREGREVAVKRP
ncbi:MAG: hypothetical protein GF313_14510 [Caldithrix sp.]|nr:hypothetical protein [Caldithrix sp.]